MRSQLTAPPQSEPIDLAAAKAHLRVEHGLDDVLILSMVASARDYAQRYTGRQLVAAGYRIGLNRFEDEIDLPTSPGLAVTSMTYLDNAGERQALDPSSYDVDGIGEVWTIRRAYNQSWPSFRMQANSVQVNFVAGYIIPFTVSGDVLTWKGLAPTAGAEIRLTNSGGELPQGLDTFTTYYVRDVSGATCKLATTPSGDAITLADAGTGIHFIGQLPDTLLSAMLLTLGHFYENREAVVTGTIATALPLAVENILDMHVDRRVY